MKWNIMYKDSLTYQTPLRHLTFYVNCLCISNWIILHIPKLTRIETCYILFVILRNYREARYYIGVICHIYWWYLSIYIYSCLCVLQRYYEDSFILHNLQQILDNKVFLSHCNIWKSWNTSVFDLIKKVSSQKRI